MTRKLIGLILAAGAISLAAVPSASASFGITSFDGATLNQDGTPDTQAGSHPYEAETTIQFNRKTDYTGTHIVPDGDVKDIEVDLPAGFAGNALAVPKCQETDLVKLACPANSQIGVVEVDTSTFFGKLFVGVYNMQTTTGVPAVFGFNVLGTVTLHITARVRSESDDGISVKIPDISQTLPVLGTKLTLWGVPAQSSHDDERASGYTCLIIEGGTEKSCFRPGGESAGVPPAAFLSNPTDCSSGPVKTILRADSWQEPGMYKEGEFVSHDNSVPPVPVGFSGCDQLSFQPTISTSPDTSQADTPAGFTVDVKVPQGGLTSPSGLASSALENTSVTLPAGVAINPGQAAGLAACQPAQDGIGVAGPPSCPAASRVGTVQVTTPLLPDKLEGSIYVLQSNPPDLKLLIAAYADGVNLKLVGDVHLDESTGQLTTTFSNTPQLPFTDLKLAFSGGAQAALTTPSHCGVYATASDFTPWGAPFTPDANPQGSFSITSGPGGSACTSTLPFSPSLIAGSTTDQAGGFTSFSLLLQRDDGQQRISTLQFKVPEGLLGKISSVALCADAQAAAGSCPASAQIGHTVVGAGPGPFPLTVPQPGGPGAPIYLTGPYKGAPYGLAIVVPVVAGPFNLGTVVVRASIAVDPNTTQLTITTDPLPAILDGVPTDLRTINAVIDRAGFMFNPTGCAPQSFSGSASSTEGTVAAIGSHFQVGSCQSLKFKPNFQVSTSGRTSRAGGASLDAKIVYPAVPVADNQASQQANIAKVKIDLPKQLPSRLTTLQKACLAAVFDVNPGNCPAASVVGSAKAVTPVLGVPLSGPAYFVSHGGEAFPSLVVVLQGDGVRVDLTGSTFISKAGITSSTFKQVPDVPITSFELKLPQGPHSALAANGNLCTSKLAMPTAFVGQNGAEIHESTKITASGCSKAKKKTKTKKAKANTKTKKTKK